MSNQLDRLPLTGRVSVEECATNPLSHPVASSSRLECPISRLTVGRVSVAVRLSKYFMPLVLHFIGLINELVIEKCDEGQWLLK